MCPHAHIRQRSTEPPQICFSAGIWGISRKPKDWPILTLLVRLAAPFPLFLLVSAIGDSISLFRLRGKMVSSLWGSPISLSTLLPPNSVSPISLAPTYPGPTQRLIFENEAWETGATVSHFVAAGLYCSLGRSRRMIDKPRNS